MRAAGTATSAARDGGTPKVRLNARENTSADDQPSSAATADTDSPRVQPPGRALEHDAAPQRGRRLPRQPAHLPREVELRRVAAARHVADVGVVGVDDRVEQFSKSVAV